jgi:hypothetical protein
MSAEVIKQLMISQIKSNGLPIGVIKTWEDLDYGILINIDGSISRHKKADYGPEEGSLADLSLAELGLILEAQEKVTPNFYCTRTN